MISLLQLLTKNFYINMSVSVPECQMKWKYKISKRRNNLNENTKSLKEATI